MELPPLANSAIVYSIPAYFIMVYYILTESKLIQQWWLSLIVWIGIGALWTILLYNFLIGLLFFAALYVFISSVPKIQVVEFPKFIGSNKVKSVTVELEGTSKVVDGVEIILK